MAQRTCSIDGCELPHKSRGWCRKHYYRWKVNGDPEIVHKPYGVVGRGSCAVDDCERPLCQGGYCKLHYRRVVRSGDPHKAGPTTSERFWAKVRKDGPLSEVRPDLGPCWMWTGATLPNGYGILNRGRRGLSNHFAHRLSHELHDGPIPEGYEVDHLCYVRNCVNPSHLEAVPPIVNKQRANKRRWDAWRAAQGRV